MIHSQRLLVFAPKFFILSLMGDIDDFLPSIMSVSKYITKINVPWCKNQEPMKMIFLCFFCCLINLQLTLIFFKQIYYSKTCFTGHLY